ncbi:MAG: helicase HerA-like domain-containing protein, partial [Clostridia bacterium]
MIADHKIWIGTGDDQKPVYLLPQMANRHGLIAGATGTGKTVSLKVLAEGFSDLGVPVFLGDIKGDLSGMVKPGEQTDQIAARLMKVGVTEFKHESYPTVFWDVYGKEGHAVRATVSEMGPLLLSRMLNLNETQTGVLSILFRVADDEGMLLLDIKDIKAMLAYVGENASKYTLNYGNVSKATIGAIQRAVAVLEDQG